MNKSVGGRTLAEVPTKRTHASSVLNLIQHGTAVALEITHPHPTHTKKTYTTSSEALRTLEVPTQLRGREAVHSSLRVIGTRTHVLGAYGLRSRPSFRG